MIRIFSQGSPISAAVLSVTLFFIVLTHIFFFRSEQENLKELTNSCLQPLISDWQGLEGWWLYYEV